MTYPFVLCDVFGQERFTGNPLAVFLDADGIDEPVMAALGREFGWSEITFVLSGDIPRVRIWTPFEELPFAGHPTIGTAVVLAASGRVVTGRLTLELGVGPVEVEITAANQDGGTATMTQRIPEFGAILEDRSALARALSLDEDDIAAGLPAQMVSTGLPHFMVPLRSLDALGRARPVPELLASTLHGIGARWAYCFTTDTPGTPAAARARLLNVGMEDAATGSAVGPLGAYLVHYGLHSAGEMRVEQGIEMGRPSVLRVDVPVNNGEIGPVRVAGDVHVWGRGEFSL